MLMHKRNAAHIPARREFVAKPHSVFCLLSPVSCLLPKPPILPSFPRIHESIMQNKPNSLTVKNNATPFATNSYANIPLPCAGKNKPNQTQSPNAIRDTQHAIRKSNPNKPNFKIGKMKISTAITKAYANEQRATNNERYSKQTQSNPIPPPPPKPPTLIFEQISNSPRRIRPRTSSIVHRYL